MWRGRKAIGEEILLGLQCVDGNRTPTAPDAAPTMNIYASGALVLSKQIPPLDRYTSTGMFEYMQPLNSSFGTGRHFVKYAYSISSTLYVGELDCFEVVAGGDSDGMKNSLFCLDRPDTRDWVLSSTDMGSLEKNRSPKV